ncbi:glycoside hydrolase family 38 C-terminal domain-containing protein [Acidianus manzaensis]|uniref:Uncharacterized protein n=1 Tax=Acidianus manzaensis TaxID=282676 RepID=A0A1W6JX72_9CREN|nr:glycoside hydrolase family 38 C-terminal domain-containing protein [Acidianus manzaensis]ARM74832.1 hypothetical protein B6F84_01520 [Acidianus manzaensis]
MSWNFKSNKINKNYNNIMCSIDEIVSSNSVQNIRQKYNISQQSIHKFVTEYLIKIYVEKKLTEEEVLTKFEFPEEAKRELANEVKMQIKERNIQS